MLLVSGKKKQKKELDENTKDLELIIKHLTRGGVKDAGLTAWFSLSRSKKVDSSEQKQIALTVNLLAEKLGGDKESQLKILLPLVRTLAKEKGFGSLSLISDESLQKFIQLAIDSLGSKSDLSSKKSLVI